MEPATVACGPTAQRRPASPRYIFRDGLFAQFTKSAGQLPRDAHSVMLRSSFMGFHPQNVGGYHATQTAQLIDRFVANGFQNYYELATRNLIDP